MATEKLEIEIIAKGKPAEKAIKGVEKKTDQLGKTTKQTGKEVDRSVNGMKESWSGLGASIAAVTVVLGASIAKAKDFERASIGLTKAQKEWAQATSLTSDATAEQIAGFLKSAQTAGLNEKAQRDLAKSAIALSYAFPHEEAESLLDNLIMLNTTGETQGFIVDILEQKMSSMGVAFEDMDLKALSASQKLGLVNEVVRDSQKAMDASKYKSLNTALGTMSNTLTNLGDKLVQMGSDSGAFATLTATVQVFSSVVLGAAHGIGVLIDKGKELLGITNEQSEQSKKEAAIIEKLNSRVRPKGIELLEKQKKQLQEVNKQLKSANENGASESMIKMLEKERKALEKVIEKQKIRLNLSGVSGKMGTQVASLNTSQSIIPRGAITDAIEGEMADVLALADLIASNLGKTFEDYDYDIFEVIERDIRSMSSDEIGAMLTANLKRTMEDVNDEFDKTPDKLDKISEKGKIVSDGLADYFTKMAMGVKVSFKDMARSVISDLLRIGIKRTITDPIANELFPVAKHTGGTIGMASIPSFHAGYRSDERLAKLQVGESVVNRAGTARNAQAIDAMNAGMTVGGGDTVNNANITFQVQAFDSASFQQGMVKNRATIVGVVREAFNRNGKSVAL